MKINVKKVNNIKKYAIKATIAVSALMLAMSNTMIAFAGSGNAENTDPTGVGGGDTMKTMVNIVFWALRIIIVLAGGVPGLMKVVQGQADENTKDRNQGLATIGVTGAVFAATFAVSALI